MCPPEGRSRGKCTTFLALGGASGLVNPSESSPKDPGRGALMAGEAGEPIAQTGRRGLTAAAFKLLAQRGSRVGISPPGRLFWCGRSSTGRGPRLHTRGGGGPGAHVRAPRVPRMERMCGEVWGGERAPGCPRPLPDSPPSAPQLCLFHPKGKGGGRGGARCLGRRGRGGWFPARDAREPRFLVTPGPLRQAARRRGHGLQRFVT